MAAQRPALSLASALLLLACTSLFLRGRANDDVDIEVEVPVSPGSVPAAEGATRKPFECDVDQWLSPVKDIVGFHVVCLQQRPEKRKVYAKGFREGRRGRDPVKFKFSPSKVNLRHAFERYLEIENLDEESATSPRQPWSVFSLDGRRLNSVKAIIAEAVVFVFEGGQWVWPGIEIGHRFNLTQLDLPGVSMETLEMTPLVFRIEGFLTQRECDKIIALARPHMSQSQVSLMDQDKDSDKPATNWRTSSTYWLRSRESPMMPVIDSRVAQLTHIPVPHQEHVQVLRYQTGQRYDAHHDYFDPQYYEDLDVIEQGHTNRLVTVFWYMSDVAEGGETGFPRAGGLPMPSTVVGCQVGLKVKPKKGMVIMFYSLLPDGALDQHSLHGGCPVASDDEKWSGNKWVWNKPTIYR